MKIRRKKTTSVVVIWAVFALMVAGLALLASELWQLQVREKSGFDEVFRSQSVRRVRLPAVRGRIYDVHGKILADSVPNYCIAIYTSELRSPRSAIANTLELLHEIQDAIGRAPDISYHDVRTHLAVNRKQPLTAWKTLSDEEQEKLRRFIAEKTAPEKDALLPRPLPGIDVAHPLENGALQIQTRELLRQPTTTVANTLELIYKISDRLGEPELPVTLKDIRDHIFARRPLPLLAWEHIDKATMAKWADTCSDLDGTSIYCQPDRHYDESVGISIGHLLGFTMEAGDKPLPEDQPFDFNMRGIEGKKGLEDKYNDLLKGRSGFQLVQIDVSGYHHRDLQLDAPQPGGDLQLAIDANIQKFAWDALTMRLDTDPFDGPVRGAVVVLNPNNGDVLAMVSSPGFDPNRYIESNRYRQLLMTNESAPTFNRAVYGQYAPGSTFKPIAALGVLREHPEYAEVTHDCHGFIMVGKRPMRCNASAGHGDNLTIRQTLEKSCNVYMYQMGMEVGYEPIRHMARDFGIGQVAGLFPDLDDPDAVFSNGGKYGNLPDTAKGLAGICNLSIGQGDLLVAPLQMAMVAAAIANGGDLYRPRLIRGFRKTPEAPFHEMPVSRIRHIEIPAQALEIVRGGMYDVVMGGREAAKVVQVDGIEIAGKTGTAEYGPKTEGKKNTWMISFAPFSAPRYAIAFIVEDGVYGGTTVAPRLHELYQDIFEYDGSIAKEGTL